MRWGHRARDHRVTSHVILTARAFGASSVILSDIEDHTLLSTVEKVSSAWGGQFSLEMGMPWRQVVERWRESGGIIVHLTMYGENIETSNVMKRIMSVSRNILVIVGSRKVPPDFFELADFNVAIGTQPHSEVAALAVFLDRLYRGGKLRRRFAGGRIRIRSSKSGKKLIVDQAKKAEYALRALHSQDCVRNKGINSISSIYW